jgi:hypothetical protein
MQPYTGIKTLHFKNAKGDTIYYSESMDSCIVGGKPLALYASPDAMEIKPGFINKKFQITYVIDNAGESKVGDNRQIVNVTVSKMILIK